RRHPGAKRVVDELMHGGFDRRPLQSVANPPDHARGARGEQRRRHRGGEISGRHGQRGEQDQRGTHPAGEAHLDGRAGSPIRSAGARGSSVAARRNDPPSINSAVAPPRIATASPATAGPAIIAVASARLKAALPSGIRSWGINGDATADRVIVRAQNASVASMNAIATIGAIAAWCTSAASRTNRAPPTTYSPGRIRPGAARSIRATIGGPTSPGTNWVAMNSIA